MAIKFHKNNPKTLKTESKLDQMDRLLHEIQYRIEHAPHRHRPVLAEEQASVICEYFGSCQFGRLLLFIVLVTSLLPTFTGIFGFCIAVNLKKRTRMEKYELLFGNYD